MSYTHTCYWVTVGLGMLKSSQLSTHQVKIFTCPYAYIDQLQCKIHHEVGIFSQNLIPLPETWFHFPLMRLQLYFLLVDFMLLEAIFHKYWRFSTKIKANTCFHKHKRCLSSSETDLLNKNSYKDIDLLFYFNMN